MKSFIKRILKKSKLIKIYDRIKYGIRTKPVICKSFKAFDVKNGFIKCEWSPLLNLPVRASKLIRYYLAIRVYQCDDEDIPLHLLKETEISNRLNYYFLPIPLYSSNIKIELGYTYKSSEWITLGFVSIRTTSININKYFIEPVADWFFNNIDSPSDKSQHETIYQMSLINTFGASENYIKGRFNDSGSSHNK